MSLKIPLKSPIFVLKGNKNEEKSKKSLAQYKLYRVRFTVSETENEKITKNC